MLTLNFVTTIAEWWSPYSDSADMQNGVKIKKPKINEYPIKLKIVYKESNSKNYTFNVSYIYVF